jgi:hypothetical protein
MKTLVDSIQQLSIFVLEDNATIEEQNGMLKINDNGKVFFLGDKNSQNTVVYYNIEAPQDWRASRYFYDGTSWSVNDKWEDTSIQASSTVE